MLDLVLRFAHPYAMYLMGATYNLQQTLDGAGLWSSGYVVRDSAGRITESYLYSIEAMAVPLAALSLYCLVLSVGYCIAGYAISRKKGLLIALFSLCLPGIVSLLGYWPAVNLMPTVYRVGSVGSLGSAYGMAALAIIALVSGWICTVIATDILGLQERFRHIYDHFWYSMAILAGLFFVADSGTSEEMRDLQDTTKHVQQASAYLLGQVREYAKFCRLASVEQRASCIWANGVQQSLTDYAAYDERLYWQLGPKSAKDLYLSFDGGKEHNETAIRSELAQFNQFQCPRSANRMAMPSSTCQRPPAQFCSGTDDGENMIRTVAVSNECVIPTLVALRTTMEKQVANVAAAARAKHARWLFYILVAFLAGGKVANATAKFTKARSSTLGLGDEYNTKKLAIAAWNALRSFRRLIGAVVRGGYRLIKPAFSWIWRLPKVVLAKLSMRSKAATTEAGEGSQSNGD